MNAKDVILARKLGGGGGGGTEITDGIVVKAYRQPDNWIQEVDFYCESGVTPNSVFKGAEYRFLTTINYKNPLTTISVSFADGRNALTTFPDFSIITSLGRGSFYGCALLNGVITLPLCTSIGDSSFRGTNITELSAPKCISVDSSGLRAGALKKVYLPKLNKFIGGNVFYGCTSLETVQLGSIGNAVEQISNNDFSGCTQTGLTITVYTTSAYADTALTNIRNGATNATIILKASEDTTYNGVAYAAGETMITSTAEAVA